MMADLPRSIFLHIPKTGGTTLRTVIRTQYPVEARFEIEHYDVPGSVDRLLGLDSDAQSKIRMIYGHHPFGIHSVFPGDWRYLTVLREPAERILSHYHYVIRTPLLRQHREIVEANFTLKEYVSRAPGARFFNNGQTRYLGASNFLREGVATRASLERAKDNLGRSFSVVGTTTRFDESLILMKRALGWDWPVYESRQVSPIKRSKDDLAPDELDMIMELNDLDVQLYEFARDRLEARLSQQSASFWSDLETFKQKQRAATARKQRRDRLARLLHAVITR